MAGSSTRAESALAGMDHAEVHYFNRFVRSSLHEEAIIDLADLVTITMVHFKSQDDS